MTNWAQEIEEDLGWREAEMGSLKLLAASAPSGSDRQRSLLRACCTLLYAHYEGFSKFCWELMLSHVAAQGLTPNELIEPLAIRALNATFKRAREDTSSLSLWKFGNVDFHNACQALATLPTDVDTQSNLWPNVALSINISLGLTCSLLEDHKNELGQLLHRRNGIAHGEKLEIPNMASFQNFERSALLVMHDLAIAVVEYLDQQLYRRTSSRIAIPLHE